jgi:hypothetical protein
MMHGTNMDKHKQDLCSFSKRSVVIPVFYDRETLFKFYSSSQGLDFRCFQQLGPFSIASNYTRDEVTLRLTAVGGSGRFVAETFLGVICRILSVPY